MQKFVIKHTEIDMRWKENYRIVNRKKKRKFYYLVKKRS